MSHSSSWDDPASREGEPVWDPVPAWEADEETAPASWDQRPPAVDRPILGWPDDEQPNAGRQPDPYGMGQHGAGQYGADPYGAPQRPAHGQAGRGQSTRRQSTRRQSSRRQGTGAEGKRPSRRQARVQRRAQEREERWQRNRLSVPYRIDGPKVTFGVLWFAAMVASILYSPVTLAVLVASVAGLAGLQVGHAWFGDLSPAKWWTAFAAFVPGVLGLLGPTGIGIGLVVALVLLTVYTMLYPEPNQPQMTTLGALVRSSIPVGLAAGSFVALSDFELGAILSLLVLVSAYEIGDFLVGSGSSNAMEGPISGIVALGAVLFVLWVIAPAPFTDRSMLLFGMLAAVCCPLGQIFASALLPRGSAWAPALRRLDSYLVAAPLWLFLLQASPDATTL